MKWSIVIPTWRRARELRLTLDSLRGQSVGDFEVVVVCDGEDADTEALASSYEPALPLRWVFHEANQGRSPARNTGAANAKGDLLLFLDDDVTASPDLLKAHEEQWSAQEEWPGFTVFGRIVEMRTAPFASKTDELMQRAWERHLAQVQPAEGAPNTLSVGDAAEQTANFGMNCSIRRSLFEEVGGFDPALTTDEDSELGLRLYRRGVLSRFARNAVVHHRGSVNLARYFQRSWRASAMQDLHRVRDLEERSAQTAKIGGLRYAPAPVRMVREMIADSPEYFVELASLFEMLTELTGSRTTFAAWARLSKAAGYWAGMRKAGISQQELTALSKPSVRMLMLHSISIPQSAGEREYYISPRNFRRCVDHIRMMGYRFISPNEWLRGDYGERSAVLTFDDGYDDLYSELLRLAQQHRIRPLVFLVAGHIGGTNIWDSQRGLRSRNLLTREQILEMQRHGVVFGAHSMTHPELTTLSNAELRKEVRESKLRLEDMLGEEVDWFAYPYGDVDRRVRTAVAGAGYKAAMTTNPGLSEWQDPFALNRIELKDYESLWEVAVKLRTGIGTRANVGQLARAIGLRKHGAAVHAPAAKKASV